MPECPCPEPPAGETRFWCERHRCWKTRHWRTLCQTRPEYRQAWEDGRGPGQPVSPETAAVAESAAAWLRCPYRGQSIAKIRGGVVGCGCSSAEVDVYQCLHFDAPVLKLADPRRTEQIARHVPGYAGRTCRTCKL